MAKLTKAIFGVPKGEIYPREIPAGEECPENLCDYAASLGALETVRDGDAAVAGLTKSKAARSVANKADQNAENKGAA